MSCFLKFVWKKNIKLSQCLSNGLLFSKNNVAFPYAQRKFHTILLSPSSFHLKWKKLPIRSKLKLIWLRHRFSKMISSLFLIFCSVHSYSFPFLHLCRVWTKNSNSTSGLLHDYYVGSVAPAHRHYPQAARRAFNVMTLLWKPRISLVTPLCLNIH